MNSTNVTQAIPSLTSKVDTGNGKVASFQSNNPRAGQPFEDALRAYEKPKHPAKSTNTDRSPSHKHSSLTATSANAKPSLKTSGDVSNKDADNHRNLPSDGNRRQDSASTGLANGGNNRGDSGGDNAILGDENASANAELLSEHELERPVHTVTADISNHLTIATHEAHQDSEASQADVTDEDLSHTASEVIGDLVSPANNAIAVNVSNPDIDNQPSFPANAKLTQNFNLPTMTDGASTNVGNPITPQAVDQANDWASQRSIGQATEYDRKAQSETTLNLAEFVESEGIEVSTAQLRKTSDSISSTLPQSLNNDLRDATRLGDTSSQLGQSGLNTDSESSLSLSSGWEKRMQLHIRQMVQQGTGQMTLRLDPAELGQLEIRVKLEQQQAHINFSSPHSHVRELIDGQLPGLRQAFLNDGVPLGQVEVQAQADRQYQTTDQQQQNQRESASNGDEQNEEVIKTNLDISAQGEVDYFI